MATPPTRVTSVTPTQGWADSATVTKTSPTFDVVSGDLIVITAFSEDSPNTLSTPTWTGTGTVTLQQSVVVSSYCTAFLYTIAVTATATGRTISQTRTAGSGQWSFYASVWRNHGGLGNTGKANTSGAPSLALTTSANSAVVCGNSDWNASSPTGRTWRTVNGTAMTESSAGGVAGSTYYAYTGYSLDTGTAGTTTVGMTLPSGQKYSIVAAEILGVAGVTPSVTTGAAGVGVALAGVPVTVATATGGVGTAVALSSAVSRIAIATASLGVAVALAGAASTVYTTTGALGLNAGLAASAVTVKTTTGSLGAGLALTGSASTVASTAGSLGAAVSLTGVATQTGTYITTGALNTSLALAGASSTVAATPGGLGAQITLTGAASLVGQYITSGNLPVTVTLASTASPVATSTGTLTATVALSGVAVNVVAPVTSGALTASLTLSGVAVPVKQTTGTLTITVGLSGVAVNPSEWHDITATASLAPNRWSAALPSPLAQTAGLDTRRWDATS